MRLLNARTYSKSSMTIAESYLSPTADRHMKRRAAVGVRGATTLEPRASTFPHEPDAWIMCVPLHRRAGLMG